MGLIEEALIDKTLTDLRIEQNSGSSNEPDLSNEKIEEAIVLLKEIEKNGGYLGIAGTVGLTSSQIKEIHRLVNKKISELTTEE